MVAYFIKIFSNYLKYSESRILLEIHLQLRDKTLSVDSNDIYSLMKDFRKICLEKVKIEF